MNLFHTVWQCVFLIQDHIVIQILERFNVKIKTI